MINRAKFFAGVRASVFGGALSQGQVDGCNAILAEWERRKLTDLRWLAYMLGTTFWETAETMQPISERGQVSYFDKYDAGTSIGNALGNTKAGDGYRYRGRGYVQLTGRSNYRKMSAILGVDLEGIPDLALKPEHAAKIMFEGMIRGTFTGKSLALYFNPNGGLDWINARRIINGTDKAAHIAGIAKAFNAALTAAQESKPAPATSSPATSKDAPAARSGSLATLLSSILKLFRKV